MTHREAANLLGLSAGATAEQVRSAYRRLAHVHHPDRGGDAATMAKLAEAYKLLRDGVGELVGPRPASAVQDWLDIVGTILRQNQGHVPDWARPQPPRDRGKETEVAFDFKGMKELLEETRRRRETETWSCEMCHNVNKGIREEHSTCPVCGALTIEGKGSQMLNDLLELENDELRDRNLEFVKSMAQQRQRYRAQGYAPRGWPSERQVKWLTDLWETYCK